jgi:hypothetical protein
VDRVTEPIEIAADTGGRADRQVKGKAVLILFLPGNHAEFHDRFADHVGISKIGFMDDFEQHKNSQSMGLT